VWMCGYVYVCVVCGYYMYVCMYVCVDMYVWVCMCVERNMSTKIEFCDYEGEKDLVDVIALIENDLSEPYSIFTYRYFINNWSRLCINVSVFLLFTLSSFCLK